SERRFRTRDFERNRLLAAGGRARFIPSQTPRFRFAAARRTGATTVTDAIRIVVMGPSGSGKSTVGAALAEHLGAEFLDADDLHPEHNVAKMRSGIPLEDADRWPWLDRVGSELRDRRAVV